jgi:predicted O-methyltransferase YrrM
MTLPDGWCSREEAAELQRLATGKTVLELGAWKGRSTVVLAEVARYVVSVDRHQGIEEVGGGDSLPDYLASVRDLANVAIVVADFAPFVPLLREAFDVVYVDGNHDVESATDDINVALYVVKQGGLIAMHDFDFGSVQEAAKSVFGCVPDRVAGSVASFTV